MTGITIPTSLGTAFAIRRIFCVGRNYAEHAVEMGGNPDREPPFFFSKPADALLTGDADMPYPPATARLEYEIELVVALRSGGSDIAPSQALDHVLGYAAGLDMTRRDLQAEAKKTGRPWDMAKGFDHSAPIGLLVPAADVSNPQSGRIALHVNDVLQQQGDLSQMIWSVAETIAQLSGLVRLAAGDLIFTGTRPASARSAPATGWKAASTASAPSAPGLPDASTPITWRCPPRSSRSSCSRPPCMQAGTPSSKVLTTSS